MRTSERKSAAERVGRARSRASAAINVRETFSSPALCGRVSTSPGTASRGASNCNLPSVRHPFLPVLPGLIPGKTGFSARLGSLSAYENAESHPARRVSGRRLYPRPDVHPPSRPHRFHDLLSGEFHIYLGLSMLPDVSGTRSGDGDAVGGRSASRRRGRLCSEIPSRASERAARRSETATNREADAPRPSHGRSGAKTDCLFRKQSFSAPIPPRISTAAHPPHPSPAARLPGCTPLSPQFPQTFRAFRFLAASSARPSPSSRADRLLNGQQNRRGRVADNGKHARRSRG